ncbi:hypothetical protein [Paenibacillus polymyxa]|uniref:hypothetical protein n=1 Tax=Paenibacillus polymyxa TaxID=1406 RepID=UPI0025B64946|nr:hypothetical protein [Paenibacillus polymyxa]
MAAFGSDGGGGTSRTVCFAKAGTCRAKEVSSANGRLYKPPVKNSWHEIVMP